MEALIDWLSFTVKEYEGKAAKPEVIAHKRSKIPSGYYEYPCIVIRGRWLEKHGFIEGKKCMICEEDGCFKIKPFDFTDII